jgi:hypothetical protein
MILLPSELALEPIGGRAQIKNTGNQNCIKRRLYSKKAEVLVKSALDFPAMVPLS